MKNSNIKKSKIAIINGLVFIKNKFKKRNIIINKNKIECVTKDDIHKSILSKCTIINAKNSYISYGFMDPHVHFRVPGSEQKEDWNSGAMAAIAGGYTFIIDMPNNNPSATTKQVLMIKNDIAKNYPLNYGFYLGLTDENADNLKQIIQDIRNVGVPLYGIKAFLGSSTGNLLVTNIASIKKAFNTNEIVLFHAEDQEILSKQRSTTFNNVASHNKNRSVSAAVHGIQKIILALKPTENNETNETEEEFFKKIKNSKIYICHTSSYEEIKTIEEYQKAGYNIIAEVTPHHLFFSTEALKGMINQSIYKVNPPIRNAEEQKYLQKYFKKGFFKIIGTDHAPHLLSEKKSSDPPSGIPGLESSFYALYSLYEEKKIPLSTIFKCLTAGYKIFGIKKRGKIKKGYFADLTIIKKEPNLFKSSTTYTKCDFSPYNNLQTNTKIDMVIINGKILYYEGKFVKKHL